METELLSLLSTGNLDPISLLVLGVVLYLLRDFKKNGWSKHINEMKANMETHSKKRDKQIADIQASVQSVKDTIAPLATQQAVLQHRVDTLEKRHDS